MQKIYKIYIHIYKTKNHVQYTLDMSDTERARWRNKGNE